MKNNKTKLVFDCNFGPCRKGSDPDYDCFDFCDSCKLCTQDGMVITKVKNKHSDVILNVTYVSGDEIIFCSENPRGLYSIEADTNKFDKEFEVVETTDDIRKFW